MLLKMVALKQPNVVCGWSCSVCQCSFSKADTFRMPLASMFRGAGGILLKSNLPGMFWKWKSNEILQEKHKSIRPANIQPSLKQLRHPRKVLVGPVTPIKKMGLHWKLRVAWKNLHPSCHNATKNRNPWWQGIRPLPGNSRFPGSSHARPRTPGSRRPAVCQST